VVFSIPTSLRYIFFIFYSYIFMFFGFHLCGLILPIYLIFRPGHDPRGRCNKGVLDAVFICQWTEELLLCCLSVFLILLLPLMLILQS